MDKVKSPPTHTTPLEMLQSAEHLPDQGFQVDKTPQSRLPLTPLVVRRAQRRAKAAAAHTILRHHAPALLEKAQMSTIADSELKPFQLATRQIRNELLAEIDNPSAIQRHLVGMCVTDLVIIETLDQYIGELASNGGIINRQDHDVYPIVEKVVVLKNMLARRMKMIGIKGTTVKTKDVYQDTLAAWRQDTGKGTPTPMAAPKQRKARVAKPVQK